MSRHDQPRPIGQADPLACLLRQAGVRPEVDPQCRARVEQAVTLAWRAQLRRRRVRRWGLALAAGLACAAVLIGVTLTRGIGTPVDLAVVVHVQGQAFVETPAGARPLAVGDRLPAGSTVRTAADGLVALSLARVASVRIDRASRLSLQGERSLTLLEGGVYLDSDGRPGGIDVHTPLLTARDIGTRFMVRHAAAGSEVSVRDGSVAVDDGTLGRLAAGEQLQLDQHGGRRRGRLPAHAEPWAWTLAAGVPFAAEGRSLQEILRWYAHESGLRLRQDPALQARLDSALQGDMAGLSADELLEVARAAGPFQLRIDRSRGELIVTP